MNTRRVFAALMSASMLCAAAVPAMAAGADLSGGIGQSEPVRLPERVFVFGTITDIQKTQGRPKAIRIQLDANSASGITDLVLKIDDQTIALDSGRGTPADLGELEIGDSIYAFHSPAIAESLPPQTYAEAIIWNVPADARSAMLHTVEEVVKTDRGLRITTGNGSLYITAANDAKVSPLYTKNIVTLEDVHVGDRIFAWYEVILTSYPGQTGTDRLVLIPGNRDTSADPIQDGYHVLLDGNTVLQQKAIVKDGVAMVPLRSLAGLLGHQVDWDEAEQAATITSDSRKMTFTVGKDLYASVPAPKTGLEGATSPIALGCAPYVDQDYRMWVPIKAFETLVGYRVVTNEQDGVIRIDKA